ncbi:hypothetical protein [Olivibacter sp. XZL3]|uniref:hypothetical protein n=1 Tax=Olivibacter sp. XZL3 TaxID=1735116 RepID=UPI001065A54E|nr:hypothetical protein [Olivibacter sp. XZL3]
MNNNKDVSFFEDKYVRKALEGAAQREYNPSEVIKNFCKKYTYIRAIQSIYDASTCMKGGNNHQEVTKQLEIFMCEVMFLLVAIHTLEKQNAMHRLEETTQTEN